MFEDIPRVTLELSNLCNYSEKHTKCPTGRTDEVCILPLSIIKSVITDLKISNWGNNRTICFHVYNEPTIDPRLYWLIEYVCKELPSIKPLLFTNGWYMNENLMKELFNIGLDKMLITLYTNRETEKLVPLSKKFPGISFHKAVLKDSLLNPGDGPPFYKRCHAPLCDLTIRSSGNVGLCCLDYDETVVFGNLYKDSLLDVMFREYKKMKRLRDRLTRRKRDLPVCKLCYRRRIEHK